MERYLPAVAALLVVLFQGLGYGLWTGHWTPSSAPREAAAQLARLPLTLGDWEGKDLEMSAQHRALAEIDGYVLRRYRHRRHGTVLALLLVCGRPGPIALHTPDVCYRGAGYDLAGPPARQAVTPDNEFWVGQFRQRDTVVPVQLRIFWAWKARGPWQAATVPRLTFAREAVLYKMYVVRETAAAEEVPAEDPSVDFLRDLLPVLEQTLGPSS